jgi:hypothetical protein
LAHSRSFKSVDSEKKKRRKRGDRDKDLELRLSFADLDYSSEIAWGIVVG